MWADQGGHRFVLRSQLGFRLAGRFVFDRACSSPTEEGATAPRDRGEGAGEGWDPTRSGLSIGLSTPNGLSPLALAASGSRTNRDSLSFISEDGEWADVGLEGGWLRLLACC